MSAIENEEGNEGFVVDSTPTETTESTLLIEVEMLETLNKNIDAEKKLLVSLPRDGISFESDRLLCCTGTNSAICEIVGRLRYERPFFVHRETVETYDFKGYCELFQDVVVSHLTDYSAEIEDLKRKLRFREDLFPEDYEKGKMLIDLDMKNRIFKRRRKNVNDPYAGLDIFIASQLIVFCTTSMSYSKMLRDETFR